MLTTLYFMFIVVNVVVFSSRCNPHFGPICICGDTDKRVETVFFIILALITSKLDAINFDAANNTSAVNNRQNRQTT